MAEAIVRDRPATRQIYTVADFEWLARLPQYADRRFEIIEGEIVSMDASGEMHGSFAVEIVYHIRHFMRNNELGRATVETGHFASYDDTTLLVPDVAFRRLDVSAELPNPGFVRQMPDLAVEIKSPNDSFRQMRRKAGLYLDRGTSIVWLVYPERREVEVCTLDADGEIAYETVGADGELSGGDALPGFTLDLSRVFTQGG